MKGPLILPLLLLGTVAAFHLENYARSLDSRETQVELNQSLEGSGEQGGDPALIDEVIQSEEEKAKPSGSQVTSEHEEAVDSNLPAPDKDFECPKEEDIIQIPSSPGCKTCNFLMVRQPKPFQCAQSICSRCYRGNLVSIHNYNLDFRILSSARGVCIDEVWIGGISNGWLLHESFRWIDGSCWNFVYWAVGQPARGQGNCVSLRTTGGRWQVTCCQRRLPFICSF
ncbi:proteoglycan 3 [Suricata suricatta]|uniref:C-type lectin domain-containing protein n=1 Tax=Suricata suricatta TaxID=37032 RepID=A0A673U780_SURSU|nr:proteoglycan 3 [Suricata suricatta]